MKICVNKEIFLETISKVTNVINPRSNLPILSNVLVEAVGSKMKLTATDLDIGITTQIQTTVNEPGAITIPAKRFFEIIKELPEGDIRIVVKKNNSIHIESNDCFFKLMGLPKEEFPKLPDFKNKDVLKFNQATLLSMLELTSFAVSHDETRYVLNGILFETNGQNLTLVATDGRRLALISKDIISKGPGKNEHFIVPTKAIQELMRALRQSEEDVNFVLTENQALFEIGNTSIVSRLIEGGFPNYKQVIPVDNPYNARLERLVFLSALRRASLLTTTDYQTVRLELFKDKMVISKSTPDVGESREEIPMQYQGKEMVIGFNPYYLVEVLKNLRVPEVCLEFSDPEKPALLKEGDYLYVVLPMRI
ncbi:MAG: DNA polymerase III subunit beta [Candidatus Omnitrophica bacterium]|nr:DNA polymerase III subunit beta [Candidatus Omnitrophota bacterium]